MTHDEESTAHLLINQLGHLRKSSRIWIKCESFYDVITCGSDTSCAEQCKSTIIVNAPVLIIELECLITIFQRFAELLQPQVTGTHIIVCICPVAHLQV